MRSRRDRLLKCCNCGYDLRFHIPGQSCPECGCAVSESIRTARQRRLWRRSPWRIIFIVLWAILAAGEILLVAVYRYENLGEDVPGITWLLCFATGFGMGALGILACLLGEEVARRRGARMLYAGIIVVCFSYLFLTPVFFLTLQCADLQDQAVLFLINGALLVAFVYVGRSIFRLHGRNDEQP